MTPTAHTASTNAAGSTVMTSKTGAVRTTVEFDELAVPAPVEVPPSG